MDNYRPISVISVVTKIFEKLIFEQLCEYLNNNNLIAASQSGFRPLHSTLTAPNGSHGQVVNQYR